MAVHLPRRSAIMLGCVGSRCCTSTKAMPLSEGMLLKNRLRASRPPAEEPSPTIAGGTWRPAAAVDIAPRGPVPAAPDRPASAMGVPPVLFFERPPDRVIAAPAYTREARTVSSLPHTARADRRIPFRDRDHYHAAATVARPQFGRRSASRANSGQGGERGGCVSPSTATQVRGRYGPGSQ